MGEEHDILSGYLHGQESLLQPLDVPVSFGGGPSRRARLRFNRQRYLRPLYAHERQKRFPANRI